MFGSMAHHGGLCITVCVMLKMLLNSNKPNCMFEYDHSVKNCQTVEWMLLSKACKTSVADSNKVLIVLDRNIVQYCRLVHGAIWQLIDTVVPSCDMNTVYCNCIWVLYNTVHTDAYR